MRAEVLGRDAARDRIDLVARDGILQRRRDVLGGDLLAAEIALHQRFVRLDDGIEQLGAVLRDRVGELGRDLDRIAFAAARGIQVRAVVEQVDDAPHLVLCADRQLNRDAPIGQLFAECAEDPEEVGALAVEHVDEDQSRELELVRAVPHTRRVHLHSHHARDDDQRALDDTQRCDRVRLEACVTRRVDQVDLAPLPHTLAEGRGQRHLSSLLVLLPVGDRRPGLDRAEPVRRLGLEQQGLHERCLARAAVTDDSDVADLPGFDGHQVLLTA